MNKRLQLTFARKPRNPLPIAARFRQAGAHGAGRKTWRLSTAALLRKELQTLKEGP